MEDRSLPRVPVVIAPAEAAMLKVTPRCEVCGTEVPDITDPKHHVCVPDDKGTVVTPAGKFTKTTRDVAAASWQKTEAEFRDEEIKAKKKNPVVT